MADDAWRERLAGWRDWRLSDAGELRALLSTTAGRWLGGAVAVIAALTVIGLLALWPYGWHTPGQAAVARTIPAKVDSVKDAPCVESGSEGCRTIVVTVEGRKATLSLGRTRIAPSVGVGDSVRVTRPGRPDAAPPEGQQVYYEFAEVDRRGSLAWIGVIVALLAVVVLRWRGVLAVIGVGLSLAIVVWFLVPAILAGRPALLVALVAALVVMFVTLILTNGLGAQTLAAALGVSATLGLTCLLAALAVWFAHLDGASELSLLGVRARGAGLSLRGIVLAAMLIGALGVLADTAVTQASAVMALRRANPRFHARRLYHEAFVIGRDHLSATIHTLVLAYAGAALPLLLVLRSGQVGALDAVNGQSIAEPIVATAVGCFALIAAVPLTTGLASLLVARVPVEALPGNTHHH